MPATNSANWSRSIASYPWSLNWLEELGQPLAKIARHLRVNASHVSQAVTKTRRVSEQMIIKQRRKQRPQVPWETTSTDIPPLIFREKQILRLSGQRRISLILIRIVMAMILNHDDKLFFTWSSSSDIASG